MGKFNHFVITRFSYRGKDNFSSIDGPTFHRGQDPLDAKRLELRFNLFEITCLPSVLGQTDQDFTWIIIVDSQLPAHYFQRLLLLVKHRKKTFIHVFDPRNDLSSLDWLSEYVTHLGYIITTNIDDDDCIPTKFIAAQHRYLERLKERNALPSIGIIGAKSALEWDLLPSPVAPFGWKAPWHRRSMVLSVGLTLYCRSPEFDVCVLGLRHRLSDTYLDFSNPPVNENSLWFRRSVMHTARLNNLDFREWQSDNSFYDITQDVGPVILSNHYGNDQATRLLESKKHRVPVTGAADFPEFAINWEKARNFVQALTEH